MEEFNRACNTLSELAFQRDLHRRYDIHHDGYRLSPSVYGGGAPGSLRDRFGAQFRVSLER